MNGIAQWAIQVGGTFGKSMRLQLSARKCLNFIHCSRPCIGMPPNPLKALHSPTLRVTPHWRRLIRGRSRKPYPEVFLISALVPGYLFMNNDLFLFSRRDSSKAEWSLRCQMSLELNSLTSIDCLKAETDNTVNHVRHLNRDSTLQVAWYQASYNACWHGRSGRCSISSRS